jgi:hypothetical protein
MSLEGDSDTVLQWCGETHIQLNVEGTIFCIPHVRPTVAILITMAVMFKCCILTVWKVLVLCWIANRVCVVMLLLYFLRLRYNKDSFFGSVIVLCDALIRSNLDAIIAF